MIIETKSRNIEENAPWIINQDGLWDIFLGLGVLGFALDMALDTSYWLISMWMAGYFIVLITGKEFITKPRTAHFKITKQQMVRFRMAIISCIILLLFILAAGAGSWFALQQGITTWRDILDLYGWILFGAAAAAFFAILAFSSINGEHFYIYALLVLAAFAIRHAQGAHPLPYIFFTSAILLIGGSIMLLRFTRRYPKIDA